VRCCLKYEMASMEQLGKDLAATPAQRLHRDDDLAAASVALHQVPNGSSSTSGPP
jgi:hypothetical protein